jgi:anti-anti-sigma regulatory factor
MSIRIDIQSEGPTHILALAGRLSTGADTEQLLAVCEQIEGQFVLDLSKLRFADEAGAEIIRSLRERGASLRGASTFVELLINGDTGCHNKT